MYRYLMEQAELFKQIADALDELHGEMQYKLTGNPTDRIVNEWYEADCRRMEQEELERFERQINNGLTFQESSDLAKKLLALIQRKKKSDADEAEMLELSKQLHID